MPPLIYIIFILS